MATDMINDGDQAASTRLALVDFIDEDGVPVLRAMEPHHIYLGTTDESTEEQWLMVVREPGGETDLVVPQESVHRMSSQPICHKCKTPMQIRNGCWYCPSCGDISN